MKRWQWALLIFELALFAIILILPQVDLPDFTFHGWTAPVVAKARLSAPPARVFTAPVRVPCSPQLHENVGKVTAPPAQSDSNSRLSLLCVRLC